MTADNDSMHASSGKGDSVRSAGRSPRRYRRLSLVGSVTGVFAVLVGALTALTSVVPAGAVDATGQFEMDGNIVHDSGTTPPYDWASLFNASGQRLVTPDPVNGPLLADTFLADTALPDPTYFQSNKDTDLISQWGCGPSPQTATPKDDLQNAYAALFTIPAGANENAGDTVLFVGSERLSNNGDSFAGFWLFKDKHVGCNTGTGAFGGSHQVGDLLIVSNYTNGGGTQAVCVFAWTGVNGDTTDCGGGTVHGVPMVNVLDGGVCPTPATGTPSDNACAIANPLLKPDVPITSPWAPTSHPGNTFVEAGIDLTQLFASLGGGDCFTTFLAETRSSQQVTATLKDFAGGQLDTCLPPPIVTTATPGGSSNLPGTAQHDHATITGTPGKPAPSGTITFTLCGPTEVDSTGCPTGSGTQVGTPVTIVGGAADSSDVTGTSTVKDLTPGKYCWRADYTPDTAGSNNYDPSTETNATTECFTIIKNSPTIATQIQVTGTGGVGVTSYGDQATLSNFSGAVTGETITFDLFGPYATGTAPSCATGANEPVFTTTGTLNAGGVATTSTTFSPTGTQSGQYVWVAHYPGDTLNNKADGACTDANESGTITPPVVTVNKTADASSVSSGTQIGFHVTVSNTGTGKATGVTLSDALPGGNAASPVHWTIDTQSGSNTFSITGADGSQQLVLVGQPASMAPGEVDTVHVVASTGSLNCGLYDNTATVSSTNGGGGSKEAQETVNCPSIHVNKTAKAASVSAGTQIGFTVTVSNSGPGDATGVTLTDPLPGGNAATPVHWTIDTQNPSNTFTITGADGHQSLGFVGGSISLANGGSVSVSIVASTSGTSCALYDNTANVTTGNDGSDSHEATETVLCPSMGVTKTSDAGTVSAGQPIGYTVTVSNGGPGDATGVTLADSLPGGNAANPVHWVIDSTTGNPASFVVSGADGSQVLSLKNQPIAMTSGSSLQVHLLAATTPLSCAVYDNSADVSATNGTGASVGPVAVTVQCPDLAIVKKAVPVGPVSTGQSIGFTVTVSNSSAPGTGTAFGVTMHDPLPAGTGIDWSISPTYPGPGTCSISGSVGSQVLDCSLGDMAPGASATVGIVSPTTGSSAGHYDNTAVAQASNNPPVSDTAGVTVLAPGLNITKTADAASVTAGSSIGFTVTVTNTGPGIAAAVAVSDPLPSGSGVSWSISPAYTGQGTCSITSGSSGQTLACTIGDMAANATDTVHITSATTTASCTSYPNTATASASNQASVTSSATTSVTCPVSQVLGITTPNTGAAPQWRDALGLMGGGLVLLLGGAGLRRRRRNTAR